MVLSVLCLKPRREPQTDKGGKTAVEFLAISNSPGSIVPSTSRQPFMNGGHRHYAITCWGTIRAHTSSPECQACRAWALPTSWKILAARAQDAYLSIS